MQVMSNSLFWNEHFPVCQIINVAYYYAALYVTRFLLVLYLAPFDSLKSPVHLVLPVVGKVIEKHVKSLIYKAMHQFHHDNGDLCLYARLSLY